MILFRTLETERETKALRSLLLTQALNYPRYEDWVDKAVHETISGVKECLLGIVDGRIVANLLFQFHKSLPGFLELKNLRVHSDFQRRLFGAFLIRQAEHYALQRGLHTVICDVHSSQTDMLNLLLASRYIPIDETRLYSSQLETVLTKELS